MHSILSIKCVLGSSLILCSLILTPNIQTNATVIYGTGSLTQGGWDFSEEASAHPDNADIFIAIVVDPPLGWVIATNYALITAMPDTTFDNITYATTDTSIYSGWAYANVGTCYIVITRENHYAKFELLELNYWTTTIKYLYQPDGSRVLYDTSAVEEYSWGRIKALFE